MNSMSLNGIRAAEIHHNCGQWSTDITEMLEWRFINGGSRNQFGVLSLGPS
jgi:hypothetical protein